MSLDLLWTRNSWQSHVRPGCACGEGAQKEMAQLTFVPPSTILPSARLVSVERLLSS